MSLYDNFSSEVETQEGIIQYIEVCCFEEEYQKARNILAEPIRNMGDIYDDNVEFIDELRIKCRNAQDAISVQYTPADTLPDWVYRIDQREPLGELIEYCIECMENGSQLVVSEIETEAESANIQSGDVIYTKEDVEKAISVAPAIYSARNNDRLELQQDIISRLLATLDMLDIRLNTNIYRQSFISLFSIFDAYVFDYVKKYFISHPKELEDFFKPDKNEKSKITFDNIIEFEDMQSLVNSLVEQKFEGKYIKQILTLIKAYKPSVFDGFDYNVIMETVNRRNIHIHNQGLVDSRYVEKYNNDKLDIGDYAQISKQYFSNATALLKKFIQNLETEFTL